MILRKKIAEKKISFLLSFLLSSFIGFSLTGNNAESAACLFADSDAEVGASTSLSTVQKDENPMEMKRYEKGNMYYGFSIGVSNYFGEGDRFYPGTGGTFGMPRWNVNAHVGFWFNAYSGARAQFGVGCLRGYNLNVGTGYYPTRQWDVNAPNQDPLWEFDKGIEPGSGVGYTHDFLFSELHVSVVINFIDFLCDAGVMERKRTKNGKFRKNGVFDIYGFLGPGISVSKRCYYEGKMPKIQNTQTMPMFTAFSINAGGGMYFQLKDKVLLYAELKGVIVPEYFDGQVGGNALEWNRILEGYSTLNVGMNFYIDKMRYKNKNRYKMNLY